MYQWPFFMGYIMGRKPSANLNLPKGMRARKRTRKNGTAVVYYFYDTGERPRREIPLGTDYHLAVKQWAQLESARVSSENRPTFTDAANRYLAEVVPGKAKNTRTNNIYAIKNLDAFFGGKNPAPLEEIVPIHITMYRDSRKETPSAANLEIRTFSHIWNKAREWGMTDRANPCSGIARLKEKGRHHVYIEEDVFNAVYESADSELKYIMDIAYLTGQRPVDIVKIHTSDIQNGVLNFHQQKTKAHVAVMLIGKLEEIISTLQSKTMHGFLFKNTWGLPLNTKNLRDRFNAAKQAAKRAFPNLEDAIENFQFRDLRAKAATDKSLSTDDEAAQKQLGHKNISMTRRYIRRSKPVKPTK